MFFTLLAAFAGISIVTVLVLVATRTGVKFMDHVPYRGRILPILYGKPAAEAIRASEEHKVYLAGCVMPMYPLRRMILINKGRVDDGGKRVIGTGEING